MRAYELSKIGAEPALVTRDLGPRAPDHLRVRVRACGLNFADLLMCKGQYQDTPAAPFTLGMEFAGEVVAGPLPAGTRVAVFAGQGGLAEFADVEAARAVVMPEGMSFEQAAGFQIAYGTSHLALAHRAALRAGETLVVLGAAGGVGLTAVEIGARMGARVVAVARGEDKLAVARAHGAQECLDADSPDLRAALKALGGADVIYDAVGGDLGTQAARALNRGGRYLVIGFASGRPPEIALNHALVKNIAVHGLYWGGYLSLDPELLAGSMRALFDWFAQGALRPHISATYPLDQAAEALESLRARRSTGKIVVTI